MCDTCEEHKFNKFANNPLFVYPPNADVVTQPRGRAWTGLLVWILGPLMICGIGPFFLWLLYQFVLTHGWTVTPVVLP